MQKGKFTEQELGLFEALESKKTNIQNELDSLIEVEQKAMEAVHAVRAKIKRVKPTLVPLAEMQAGLANAASRDKYFPDFSKNDFIKHVEGEI